MKEEQKRSDEPVDVDKLLQVLLSQEGVKKAFVSIEVTATVRRQNTGEVDETYQEIRERIITEDEMGKLVEDTDWNYLGCIDIVGDYNVRDRFTRRYTEGE